MFNQSLKPKHTANGLHRLPKNASADELAAFLKGLMPDPGRDPAYHALANNYLDFIASALVWLRDEKGHELTPSRLRDALSINGLLAISCIPDLPETCRWRRDCLLNAFDEMHYLASSPQGSEKQLGSANLLDGRSVEELMRTLLPLMPAPAADANTVFSAKAEALMSAVLTPLVWLRDSANWTLSLRMLADAMTWDGATGLAAVQIIPDAHVRQLRDFIESQPGMKRQVPRGRQSAQDSSAGLGAGAQPGQRQGAGDPPPGGRRQHVAQRIELESYRPDLAAVRLRGHVPHPGVAVALGNRWRRYCGQDQSAMDSASHLGQSGSTGGRRSHAKRQPGSSGRQASERIQLDSSSIGEIPILPHRLVPDPDPVPTGSRYRRRTGHEGRKGWRVRARRACVD